MVKFEKNAISTSMAVQVIYVITQFQGKKYL